MNQTAFLLIENGLQNAVTAFQRYAEALYTRHPGAPKARRNIFQNLHEGSVIWHATFGKNYLDHIGKPKLDNLIRMFQQRHLLAHQEGIVDADYISRSGDGRYTQGQRIVVRGDAVQECLDIIEKLASGLASDLDRS